MRYSAIGIYICKECNIIDALYNIPFRTLFNTRYLVCEMSHLCHTIPKCQRCSILADSYHTVRRWKEFPKTGTKFYDQRQLQLFLPVRLLGITKIDSVWLPLAINMRR